MNRSIISCAAITFLIALSGCPTEPSTTATDGDEEEDTDTGPVDLTLTNTSPTGDGDPTEVEPSADGILTGIVFKTLIDRYAGTLSCIRIVSGKLTADTSFLTLDDPAGRESEWRVRLQWELSI